MQEGGEKGLPTDGAGPSNADQSKRKLEEGGKREPAPKKIRVDTPIPASR